MNGMKESERKRERERSFKTSIIRRVRSFEGTTTPPPFPLPSLFFIQFSFPSSGNESKSPDLPPNADPNFLEGEFDGVTATWNRRIVDLTDWRTSSSTCLCIRSRLTIHVKRIHVNARLIFLGSDSPSRGARLGARERERERKRVLCVLRYLEGIFAMVHLVDSYKEAKEGERCFGCLRFLWEGFIVKNWIIFFRINCLFSSIKYRCMFFFLEWSLESLFAFTSMVIRCLIFSISFSFFKRIGTQIFPLSFKYNNTWIYFEYFLSLCIVFKVKKGGFKFYLSFHWDLRGRNNFKDRNKNCIKR